MLYAPETAAKTIIWITVDTLCTLVQLKRRVSYMTSEFYSTDDSMYLSSVITTPAVSGGFATRSRDIAMSANVP